MNFTWINITTLLAALLSALGCTQEPTAPLRVGLNAWPGYEFIYLAQEKGFLREAGVEVRLVEFSSLSDARRSYQRGQLDVLFTTVVEVLQARDQSRRSPQIVRVIDYSNGADVILTRQGWSAENLKGSRIGVELASLGIYVLARGVEIAGLTINDVTTVGMDQLSMEEAFSKGEIDAVVTYPPTSVKLLRDSRVGIFFSTATIPGEVVDVIAVDLEVTSKRKAEIEKLLSSFDRAMEYAKQHPEESYAIMAERQGISPVEFAAALNEGITLLSKADQPSYLEPGGKLNAVIENSDRILRQTKQLVGPDRRQGVVNSAFSKGH